MKRGLIMLFVPSLVLAGAAGWYLSKAFGAPGAPTAATPSTQPTVQTVNGETVVIVSPDAQRASHIEVAPLAAASRRPEIDAYATVLDLQPLFALRNRVVGARASVGALAAQAARSRAQYQRSRALFADDRNISQKALQDAESTMRSDEAKLQSAKAAMTGLDGALRQQFGSALAKAAAAADSTLFGQILSGRAAVLRVTLPASFDGAAPASIAVDLPDGRAVPAGRLSRSPVADPAVPGSPWLYLAARPLPAGLPMNARVPTSNATTSALIIPERAVLWYGGQRWVYVRTAADRFTRRYVPAGDEGNGGFAVTSGFRAGDAIVTQGAQLLLSQELKPQGIATACKDPPECDD